MTIFCRVAAILADAALNFIDSGAQRRADRTGCSADDSAAAIEPAAAGFPPTGDGWSYCIRFLLLTSEEYAEGQRLSDRQTAIVLRDCADALIDAARHERSRAVADARIDAALSHQNE